MGGSAKVAAHHCTRVKGGCCHCCNLTSSQAVIVDQIMCSNAAATSFVSACTRAAHKSQWKPNSHTSFLMTVGADVHAGGHDSKRHPIFLILVQNFWLWAKIMVILACIIRSLLDRMIASVWARGAPEGSAMVFDLDVLDWSRQSPLSWQIVRSSCTSASAKALSIG